MAQISTVLNVDGYSSTVRKEVDILTTLTQKIEVDGSGKPIYIGYAEPGTAVTTALWQIKKISYNASGVATDIQFASGTSEFDKVWNDRAGYSYS